MWGKDLNRLSPKRTYRWLTNIGKDAQHRSLLEKHRSNLQWDITSHQSEWLSAKNLQIINIGKDVDKRVSSYTVSGNVIVSGNINWYRHYGRQYGYSFKNLGIKPSYDPAIPFLGIYLEETKIEKDTSPNVHCNIIYNSEDTEAT